MHHSCTLHPRHLPRSSHSACICHTTHILVNRARPCHPLDHPLPTQSHKTGHVLWPPLGLGFSHSCPIQDPAMGRGRFADAMQSKSSFIPNNSPDDAAGKALQSLRTPAILCAQDFLSKNPAAACYPFSKLPCRDFGGTSGECHQDRTAAGLNHGGGW